PGRRVFEFVGHDQLLGFDRRRARLGRVRSTLAALGQGVAVRAPERRKGKIEDEGLVLSIEEERSARVIHLLAWAEIDKCEGGHERGKASRRYVKPRAPQETAEDQQVVGEMGG